MTIVYHRRVIEPNKTMTFVVFCRLTGRGTVEFTIEKGDGSTFSPDSGGEQKKLATIQVC